MLRFSLFAPWLALPGIVIVGRFEEHGWKPVGAIIPITYVVCALWLITTGRGAARRLTTKRLRWFKIR